MEVVLTVWGDKAKEDDAQWQNGPVLGVKKCKVSDFNGVSLSTLGSSQLIFEPEVSPESSAAFVFNFCLCANFIVVVQKGTLLSLIIDGFN